MFNTNAKLREALPVVAVISPQTVANTEVFSTVVDFSGLHQAIAIAALGDMAAEAIDVKFYACDSNGSNATAVTSATQLAAHASNNDNKQVVINVRAEDLLASGKRYGKFGVVTGGATGGAASLVVLGQPRAGVASAQDLASVVQLVG